MSDLDRAAERLRQTSDATRQAVGRPTTDRPADPFAPGAHVFDRVTGLDAVIVARRTDDVVVAGAAVPVETIHVRFADARIVARSRSDLTPRPTPSPIPGEPRRI